MTQSLLSDLPALAEPSSSRHPNYLRQSAAAPLNPNGTHYRENDPADDQPRMMSPIGEIAIDENDIVIAVMGPTGAGKTTFVDCAVGSPDAGAGHDLVSCTKEIRAVRCPHPDGERNIVLVDTPGFDDTFMSDTQVLRNIAEWLKATYKQKVLLSGLLYFHRILDNRVAGTPLRNLNMFKELCGKDNFKNVVLVTTMWDEVLEDVGLQREEELQNEFWKVMTRLGSTTRRFHLTKESAWEIIGAISVSIPEERRPLLIQQEMVDEYKPLHKTSSGKTVLRSISYVFSGFKRFFGRSKKDIKRNKNRRGKHRLSRWPSSSIASHISRSSGVTTDESVLTGNTDTSGSTGAPSEHDYRVTLEGLITILMHAHNMSEFVRTHSLTEAIASSLSIAQALEVMDQTHHALLLLVENAALLIGVITEHTHKARLTSDVKRVISGFATDLRRVDGIVQNIVRRNSQEPSILQDADICTLSSCVESMRHACNVLRQKLLPGNRPALFKIDVGLAAVITTFKKDRITFLSARKHLELCPASDFDHALSTYARARFLSVKFSKGGDLADLEQAISLHRDVLALSPTVLSYQELALCLSKRFDQLAIPADIDEAIALESSALELLSSGDSDWAKSHRCLALYHQKKITQPTLKADPEDVRQQVMNAVYDTLGTLPPRLLNTHTGSLYDRDALISVFENSQQCKGLLSSVEIRPTTLHDDIHKTVSRYFKYATLSHRWGKNEPLIRHVQDQSIYKMSPTDGLVKLRAFCATTCDLGYLWGWSDTCCIDKSSSVELARAIASMFSWYRRSALTVVYLADVSSNGDMSNSAWFTRGWTLQELLAPRRVLFYTREWSLYKGLSSSNHKKNRAVLSELKSVTGIPPWSLTSFNPGMDDVRLRLQWASGRRTTEPEDIAYSLFGIFNVFLPIIPGEPAENALGRFLVEIISQSGDISVLDWVGKASSFHSCFPARITSYQTTPCPRSTFNDSKLGRSMPGTQEPVDAQIQLFKRLSMSDPPQFIGRQLRLSCIKHQVTAVWLQQEDLSAPQYMYKIEAEGLIPFDIILSSKLIVTDTPFPYVLIRPWHSRLLASSTRVRGTTASELDTMLAQPFSALLLEEQSGNEYKRIASSSLIIARPADASSIFKSEVQTLNIV